MGMHNFAYIFFLQLLKWFEYVQTTLIIGEIKNYIIISHFVAALWQIFFLLILISTIS